MHFNLTHILSINVNTVSHMFCTQYQQGHTHPGVNLLPFPLSLTNKPNLKLSEILAQITLTPLKKK